MRGRQPNPRGESLTARQKRGFAIVGGLLIVVVAGLGAWAALGNGSYGRSADGCPTSIPGRRVGGSGWTP